MNKNMHGQIFHFIIRNLFVFCAGPQSHAVESDDDVDNIW